MKRNLMRDLAARDCAARFRRGEDIVAVATIGREQTSLLTKLTLERVVGESSVRAVR